MSKKNINFREEYKDLIVPDIPRRMPGSSENRGGYLRDADKPALPKKYQKKIIRRPDDFIACYCEDY